MRNRRWTVIVLTGMILLSNSSAFPQGFSGFFDFVNNTTKDFEDGDTVSESDTSSWNLYLNFQKPITDMLSYQINLRTNYSDRDLTDADGDTTTTFRRSLEPTVDVLFGNPVYNVTAGYRREEDWTTAHLNNESRETTEFYYSRINISPPALPSINVQLDEQKNFDHLDVRDIDRTTTSYLISSTYDLPSRELDARYTITYSRNEDRTPLSTTSKTTIDNFNTSYNIGYGGRFWRNKATYAAGYQGNYSRSKTDQFVDRTGSLLNERPPLGGFYAQGTAIQPDVDVLSSQGNLVDDDVDTSTGIGISSIGSDEFQNIGIQVSSARSVDRLFIYVNQDISSESVLNSTGSWEVWKSNFNQVNTWSSVPISSVTVEVVDIINNISRYEIQFSSSQNASFFKAINLQTSSVANVFVTEIEALGTDTPDDDIFTTVSKSFTQGINFNAAVNPVTKLTLAFHYFLDRRDQNPVSFTDSVGGVFENIFSDSISGDENDFISDITRNYGTTTTWLTHRLLTTTFRFQRSESFDNVEETDVRSNTYNLSFNSVPLPTLDTTLSFVRNDTFNFNDRSTTSDSVLLSINSALYRDVNMITDFDYTRSKSFETDTTSSSTQISGTIDAVFTRSLAGNFTYDVNWISTGDSSSQFKEGTAIITYRPGQFISISGDVRVSDADGDLTTSEGILIDWLPLRDLRTNLNYQHTDSDTEPDQTDTVSGFVIWYVARFADIRFTYSYTLQKAETELKNYSFNTNVNCRF